MSITIQWKEGTGFPLSLESGSPQPANCDGRQLRFKVSSSKRVTIFWAINRNGSKRKLWKTRCQGHVIIGANPKEAVCFSWRSGHIILARRLLPMNRSSGKTFATEAEKPNSWFGNANHRCKTIEAPSVRKGSIHSHLSSNTLFHVADQTGHHLRLLFLSSIQNLSQTPYVL